MLACAIGCVYRPWDQTCGRRYINNMSKPLPHHYRIGYDSSVEDTVEVYLEDAAPLFEGEVAGVADDGNARIVEKVIERSIFRDSLVDEPSDVLLVRNIDPHSVGLSTVLRDGRRHSLGVVVMEARDYNH